jgi:hypothetical protein
MNAPDPKVVDGELAELSLAVAKLTHAEDREYASLHYAVGDKRQYVGRAQTWGLSDLEALERARRGQGVAPYDLSRVTRTIERLGTLHDAMVEARARIGELQAVWREHRWSRFFLVQGGHIHSSTACSSCRVTTEFGWLPQLSGETEAQAVAAHGALLCTFCYPTAPVEWTNGREIEAAAKAAGRCEGSGRMYDPGEPHQLRQNYKWGTCQGCGTRQTLTSTGKVRAHKA